MWIYVYRASYNQIIIQTISTLIKAEEYIFPFRFTVYPTMKDILQIWKNGKEDQHDKLKSVWFFKINCFKGWLVQGTKTQSHIWSRI